MDNTTLKLCATAQYLAHDTQLIVMLSIKSIAAVVGLLLLAVLFKVQGTYLAFHSNARLLFINHHVWVVLQAILNLLSNSFSLIRFAMNISGPCDYLITMKTSVLVRGSTTFAIYGQVWALAAMAVERCIATYNYRDYEKRMSGFGKLLVTTQWLLAGLLIYIAISGVDFSEMKAYPTVSSARTSSTLSTLIFTLAGVEVTAIGVFLGLLWYNRRKSTEQGSASLTEKYQVGENIRATRLMIPMVLTHFCCFMPSLIALPVYMKFIDPTVDQRYYTVYLETVSISSFYSTFLPIVLFWRHKALRQNLKNALGMNVISPDAPRDQQHVRHFELLKDMWKGPPEIVVVRNEKA